jgi:hypothetical protein
MKDQPANGGGPAGATGALGLPLVAGPPSRPNWTGCGSGRNPSREGGAIAATRRPLPMTEADASPDRAPIGRDEAGRPMGWLRRHHEHH